MILQKYKALEVIITFTDKYTEEGMEDILHLLDAEVLEKLSKLSYVIKLDPLDYSKLNSLFTADSVLITKGLGYE